MIGLFNRASELDQLLSSLKSSGEVLDYRVYLTLNNEVKVFVIQGTLPSEETLKRIQLNDDETCEIYNDKDAIENDYFLKDIFKESSSINLNDTRRRMTSLFEKPNLIKKGVPVVTFYSYKGGVGRSTALASCAAYLSYHFKKKIAILDCDFEAPGFSNFFMEAPDSPINREGLVEYFIDEAISETPVLSKYYWQVSKHFSGQGEIYVFPAGNLDDTEPLDGTINTHRAHYLNGLTRIDMFSPDALSEQFEKLFNQIQTEINPDVIFIDSRTGFNDIFGLSVFRLSDAVVGFFGNNTQSLPGLDFFLELLVQETSPRLIVVNSIIPATHRYDRIIEFKQYIDDYLEKISFNPDSDDDARLSIESFFISSNEVLNNIGTKHEDYRDFVDLISNKSFPEYNLLFERIEEMLDEIYFNITKKNISNENKSEGDNGDDALMRKKSSAFQIKKRILTRLRDNMPQLYAEHVISYSEEYNNNRYFYRECMVDLFNPSKFLVVGNKGTGKTYIYKSLQEKGIVEELKRRANRKEDYQFIQAVKENRRFDTIKLNNDGLNSLEYERFWLVYIWNTIMLDSPFGYKTDLPTFFINDDTATKDNFIRIINDNVQFKSIENDLMRLDNYLFEKKGSRVVVIFDELDSIVNPVLWTDRVSPLINLCKKMSFRTISPKLFVRSDLYERTGNINNKNELKNRSIDIEWNREELFAFFFKHLFSHSKEDFFELMRNYGQYSSRYVNKLIRQFGKVNNQIPTDPYYLQQMCGVFFGEYADENNSARFGRSYDWFFRNLQNANGTLSLRPFIDLISISVDQALNEDVKEYPILSPLYYTMGKNRAKAVEHHFEDLAAESGNEDLEPIITYIKEHASRRYKKDKLFQQDFFSLLDNIIENVRLINNKDRDSIIKFLEINGIISHTHVRYTGFVRTQYTFALLYKYYLGLKSQGRRLG